MAGESKIAVTEGAGKNVHTWQRLINAVNVEEDVAIPGEPYLPSYMMVTPGVLTTTANSHMLQIMAGASLNVRIRRITVTHGAPPAAVSVVEMAVFRLTTAGTGGTVITATKKDNGDPPAGATGMTLPTVKGTEGTQLWEEFLWLGTAAIPTFRSRLEWIQSPNTKPIIIPAGTANGIAIKNISGLATSQLAIVVEFDESSFVL